MNQRPPTLDPIAAARLARRALPAVAASPWLHEEVARRMQERLEWIRLQPKAWAHWDPLRGGLEAHALLAARYPQSRAYLVEADPARARAAARQLAPAWWKLWSGPRPQGVIEAPEGGVDMIWANMALHLAADPQALIGRWHRALATDGFLMFSSFGPDTLRELRALYAALAWPPAGPEFTDMHDWGDMLVNAGFAEPVMDMERITLTWTSADALLAELRGLGANLHPQRFPALRGRAWLSRLRQELTRALADDQGRLALTFEIIYGHAVKPAPRLKVAPESAVSLQDMRSLLRGSGPGRPSP